LEFQPTGCEEHVEICYRSRACGVHVKNIGWRRSVMERATLFITHSAKCVCALEMKFSR
jgi:hypothetical protein